MVDKIAESRNGNHFLRTNQGLLCFDLLKEKFSPFSLDPVKDNR
jgi:hypothetical protein